MIKKILSLPLSLLPLFPSLPLYSPSYDEPDQTSFLMTIKLPLSCFDTLDTLSIQPMCVRESAKNNYPNLVRKGREGDSNEKVGERNEELDRYGLNENDCSGC